MFFDGEELGVFRVEGGKEGEEGESEWNKGLYTSSARIVMSWAPAMETISSRSERGIMAPVGLLGVLRMRSLVFPFWIREGSVLGSSCQFLEALAFQSETLAPRVRGTWYSCE